MNLKTKTRKKITVGKSRVGEYMVVLNDDTAPLGFVKIYGDTKEQAIRNAEKFIIVNELPYDID